MIHPSQRNLISIGLISILALLSLLWPSSILADEPVTPAESTATLGDKRLDSVTIVYFGATGRQDSILVSWETASENNVLGFNVYRGTTEQRESAMNLNASLIPSQGSGGGQYSFTDNGAAAGTTYYYWLGVLGLTGREYYYGPVTAQRTANHVPEAVSVSPRNASSAPNTLLHFTAVYTDTDGCEDLRYAELLISTSATQQTRCLYARYDRQAKQVYLRNNDNSAWLSSPTTQTPISNTYAILYPANTQVTAQENTLTVRWAVAFKSSLSPRRYQQLLRAEDVSGASKGWQHLSNWTVNYRPSAWKVMPADAQGSIATFKDFKAYYRDGDGYAHLANVELFIGQSWGASAQGIRLRYNQNSNRVYLWDETSQRWLGGYEAGTPGRRIENSFVIVNVQGTWARASSSTALQVNWSIRFKPAFTGSYGAFLRCADDLGAGTTWSRKGSITIQ